MSFKKLKNATAAVEVAVAFNQSFLMPTKVISLFSHFDNKEIPISDKQMLRYVGSPYGRKTFEEQLENETRFFEASFIDTDSPFPPINSLIMVINGSFSFDQDGKIFLEMDEQFALTIIGPLTNEEKERTRSIIAESFMLFS